MNDDVASPLSRASNGSSGEAMAGGLRNVNKLAKGANIGNTRLRSVNCDSTVRPYPLRKLFAQ